MENIINQLIQAIINCIQVKQDRFATILGETGNTDTPLAVEYARERLELYLRGPEGTAVAYPLSVQPGDVYEGSGFTQFQIGLIFDTHELVAADNGGAEVDPFRTKAELTTALMSTFGDDGDLFFSELTTIEASQSSGPQRLGGSGILQYSPPNEIAGRGPANLQFETVLTVSIWHTRGLEHSD